MKTYEVTYQGNSTRFKNFEANIRAETERDAVEKIYSFLMDSNYFPQEDGSVKDCDGEIIASPTDNVINYDGGYFYAEEILQIN